jgi:hypothetical protein
VYALLTAEIEAAPGNVQRVFEITAPVETARGGPEAAADAAMGREVTVVQLIRTFAGTMALDTKIVSALSQIRSGVARAIVVFLRALHTAVGFARRFYLLQISRAVRIGARLFGNEYASTVVAATKAVEDKRRAV